MAADVSAWGVLEAANAVKSGRCSAVDLAKSALDRIAHYDPAINAVTRVLRERALLGASMIDAKIAKGVDPGPLAGVPFGAKDLFDVEGLATTAGAARRADDPPARSDADAIVRLQEAGAVLVATLNMDEFAYGFVTDNACWGLTRNPHDPARIAGGSSGGSAASVAARMLPFALGSDTNGSIRIPASLCGIYGIKPTHGSISSRGTFPLARTLDDIGVFARSISDLAAVDDVLRTDATDDGGDLCRTAMLGGWFQTDLAPDMRQALQTLSRALGNPPLVDLPRAAQARSAAFLITAFEGGALHRGTLIADPLSYDLATRDRLLAGAALPEDVYQEALDFRRVFEAEVNALFERYEILIAPATFGSAPLIDALSNSGDGAPHPARANLGRYTQPISFLGLPVVAAPLVVEGLPLGVQVIAAKGRDRALMKFVATLEERGLTFCRYFSKLNYY